MLDRSLRALQVGVEVPEVGLGVAILLAGDLALGDLFDELGRAGRHVDRFHLDRRELLLQRGDVLVELVGERGAALGGVLLEQQVLEAVPTGELRIVDTREVVDARVDLAVDLLDQACQRLDALPRRARRCVRVLRGLQVTGAHGVGEYLDETDELVDLGNGVRLVLGRRLLGQRVRRRGRGADVVVELVGVSVPLPASLLEQPATINASATTGTSQARCRFIEPPRVDA